LGQFYLNVLQLAQSGHCAQNPLAGVDECYGDFSRIWAFPRCRAFPVHSRRDH
jgi:hypothetical protein